MEPCQELMIGNRYRLHEEIGRGGVGTVWKAHSVALDIPCAIKFLLPQYTQDPAQRARFVHEARAAAALRSEHTVLVFDVDEWDGVPYIAMELLNGQSLEQCLQARGTVSPQFTCEVVNQIALGLSKAHAAGLVHRDLKPDNVFLVENEGPLLVKILDFGIAKRTQAPLDFRTVTGAVIGTPYYMSPEQAKGSKDVDFRSDLWSLAVLTFRSLTGRLPFDGESLADILLKIVHGEPPSICAANPALPRAVESWWRRACDRDPGRRPRSAAELAKGLQQALFGANALPAMPEYLLSGTRMRPAPLGAARTAAFGGERKGPMIWIAVASALLMTAAGYWFSRDSTPIATPADSNASEHRLLPSSPQQADPPQAVRDAPPVGADVPRIVAPRPQQAAEPHEEPAAPGPQGAAEVKDVQDVKDINPEPPLDTAAPRPNTTARVLRSPHGVKGAAALRRPPAPPQNTGGSKPKSGLDDRLGF